MEIRRTDIMQLKIKTGTYQGNISESSLLIESIEN